MSKKTVTVDEFDKMMMSYGCNVLTSGTDTGVTISVFCDDKKILSRSITGEKMNEATRNILTRNVKAMIFRELVMKGVAALIYDAENGEPKKDV